MVAKLIRLTHKIAMKLHLAAERVTESLYILNVTVGRNVSYSLSPKCILIRLTWYLYANLARTQYKSYLTLIHIWLFIFDHLLNSHPSL